VFDYYKVAPSSGTPNAVVPGSVLPAAVYYPAAEVSYDRRALYVFGGATAVNVPATRTYALDLAAPTGSAWTETTGMPVARYGHKAVIINR
jgi:hypothetical protein